MGPPLGQSPKLPLALFGAPGLWRTGGRALRPPALRRALWLVGVFSASPAGAWIWPEHRDIAVTAIQGLSGPDRSTLETLWDEAKGPAPSQLCPAAVDPGAEPVAKPADWPGICVDFASFPALAGDHSCSTASLEAVAAAEAWGRKVVWVAAQTKERLASAANEASRTDIWNFSHLAMQHADPAYLTRAAGNNAHFVIPRAPAERRETLEGYVARALAPETEINATGIYVQYHALALRIAARHRSAPAAERPSLARRALLAEGIALHFLEDSFSAGHYAATWGSAPWQKGTHDLYCVIGLTSMTWKGELFESHGDAHMTGRDEKVAAAAVRRSIAEWIGAATGRLEVSAGPLVAEEQALEAFDFCKASHLAPMPLEPAEREAALNILAESPVPSGGPDSIHPPRARADIGLFLGVVSGVAGGVAFGGYDTTGGERFRGELEVGGRVGYGVQGVLTTNLDGQLWAQASYVVDPAQLDLSCPGCPGGERGNKAVPRVPARSGLKLALRMPSYLLPFDLVLLGPVLLLASPNALQNVVLTATAGGLLTLQRPLSTGIGTFQFMAGREFGLTFWGMGGADQFIATPSPGTYEVVNYKSLELDFPVVEYVPPRAFATVLSLAAEVQLGFTVEFPQDARLQVGNAPYELGPSWLIYLRLRLDARKYVSGSSEDWKG